jgi:hypothetical protein
VRLRPGGVLPARLVTGLGLAVAVGDRPGEGMRDEAPISADRKPPEAGAGEAGGWAAGTGTGRPGADRGELKAMAEFSRCPGGAAVRWLQEMTDAPGPPSRPAAITARHAMTAAATAMPASRIRRNRRPEGSLNTGRRVPGTAGSRACAGRSTGPGEAIPLARTPVTAAE